MRVLTFASILLFATAAHGGETVSGLDYCPAALAVALGRAQTYHAALAFTPKKGCLVTEPAPNYQVKHYLCTPDGCKRYVDDRPDPPECSPALTRAINHRRTYHAALGLTPKGGCLAHAAGTGLYLCARGGCKVYDLPL